MKAENLKSEQRFANDDRGEANMKLDLHTHSTASDGQYSPAEMVQKAKDAELELYALTDHDTVAGQKEVIAKAKELGVHYIPGIEISTQEGEEIHILGLFIDPDNKILLEKCQIFEEDRRNRGKKIVAFLQEKGIDISLEEVQKIAGNGSLGRPHFAEFLLEHGYVNSKKEAFTRYLNTQEFHRKAERIKPSPVEAIELIHQAGGKAVLAHPGLLKMGKQWQEELTTKLAAAGLDGIECFYQKHTFMQIKFYLKLAKEHHLAITCGSDFHGEKVKPNVPFGMELDEKYRELLLTPVEQETGLKREI